MLKDLTSLIKVAKDIGFPDWLANELVFGLTLLGVLISIFNYFYSFGKWIILLRKNKLLNRDLHPYFTPFEIDKATRFYIPTKYQDTAPSQGHEPGRLFIDSPKARLIPMMLNIAFKRDDTRYYLILADSGMGKTTFMINLYLAYKRQWAFGGIKYNIELFPLGYPDILKEIESVKNPEDTILLLDAFDEDTEALRNYKNRLEKILQKTRKFREIVITCRTQFFPSEIEEPYKTGMFKFGGDAGEFVFRKAYVSVFDDKDVKKYLQKRFNIFNPFNWNKLKVARQIAKKSPNLIVRPMLLSHIEDLVNTGENYEYSYQIYEVLIERWIEREASKQGIIKKYGSEKKFKEMLYDFSQKLAVNLYENRKNRGGLFLPPDTKIADAELQISDIEGEDNTLFNQTAWRSRSLLNRDAEGNYKFSHKSVLEYFLAKEAIEKEAFLKEFDFDGMDAAKTFLGKMVIRNLITKVKGEFTTTNSKIKGPHPLDQFESNALSTLDKINVDNASQINLWCFIHLMKEVGENFSSISLSAKYKLPILYLIYNIQKNNGGNAEQTLIEFPFPIKSFNYLLNSLKLKYLTSWEPSPHIKSIRKNESYFTQLSNQLDELEINELIGLGAGHELPHRIKRQFPELYEELHAANNYIKRCKELQEALPDIKINY